MFNLPQVTAFTVNLMEIFADNFYALTNNLS